MSYSSDRKLLTVLIFKDLFKLQRKLPFNYEKAEKEQKKRLKALVESAYEIPFYKERFESAGVTPDDINEVKDLAKLPLLTKDELREFMKNEDEKGGYEFWYHDRTSGSTGNPLMLLFSPKEKAYNMANWFRVMLLCGYNPFFGKTMSPVSTHSQSGSQKTVVQKFGILKREFLDNSRSEEEIIEHINTYKPGFLYTNKSTLMKIALYAKSNGIEINKPKWFCPTGEKVDDNARKVLCEAFGNNLVDSYGTTETGAVLTKFGDMEEYITNEDLFAVNIYDDDGNLADEGRIVITPLYCTDLPIINYVIGDRVKSKKVNGHTVITEIEGRLNDYFKHSDGSITTYFEMNKFLGEFDEVLQFRFIQKSYDLVHVQCVKNKDKDTDIKDIEKILSDELNKKFKEKMNLEFEWMESIPPEANGKLRVIVCEV